MLDRDIKLYLPFIVFVLFQTIVIVVAPSKAPEATVVSAPGQVSVPGDAAATAPLTDGQRAVDGVAPGDASSDMATGAAAPGTGAASVNGPAAVDATSSGSSTAPASSGGNGGGGADVPGPATPTTSPTTPSRAAPGDTSHCTPDGRQTDVVYHAPPCAPRWAGGDNGGATYRGVTQDRITVVVFRENKNPAVTAILRPEGLRASAEEEVAMMEASEAFLNEHYEFYGRELDLIMWDAPACPETPPDPAGCNAEANRLLEELDPFMVVWIQPNYGDTYNVWAQNQVISIGGWHHDRSYFASQAVRPFRWDLFMDGGLTAEMAGEYYCKKLANQNATHTGRFLHSSFPGGGPRGTVPRRAGVVVPVPDATRFAGEYLATIIEGCTTAPDQAPIVYPYESNIETGAQQSNAITQAMIADRITTVICMCDPIAPAFRMANQTRNGYFPEIMIAGNGLLDYDKIGRLYDSQQMAHAFGPSHLGWPEPLETMPASQVWRAAGNSGNACSACNLPWSYYSIVGSMLQNAGPNLTPWTVEAGMQRAADRGGWAETGGDPVQTLIRFSEPDYSGVSDAREVYWDPQAISPIDGRPGSWVPTFGGQRWTLGSWPSTFDIPVAPQ